VTFTKSPLEIGAGMSLNSIIELFEDVASGNTDYKYCKTMADHIRKVAHTSVRNAGTVGGNLMLKHAYPEFPSDLFLLLETVGATLVIKTYDNTEEKKTALEFLSTNMDKKVLLKIQLPAMTSNFFSYKTMARKQNTHAYVNAALKISVDADFNVIEKPSLVFGGISESFVHATNTEQLLVGKNMKQLTTLQAALASLKSEVAPDDNPVLATPAYRTNLTQSLFYRVSHLFIF
jgi:xanthine dehydrogenase/oxidase